MATNEQILKTRIIHKHDTEEHWNLATNFVPKQGELIVYDIDANYNYERFKIGDGSTLVGGLPFVNGVLTNADIDEVCGNITYDNAASLLSEINNIVG